MLRYVGVVLVCMLACGRRVCVSRCVGSLGVAQRSVPDKKVLVAYHPLCSNPLIWSVLSSGVGVVSASSLANTVPGPSMASGPPGRSGPTARGPAVEESCTGSAPAAAPGMHTCKHMILYQSTLSNPMVPNR